MVSAADPDLMLPNGKFPVCFPDAEIPEQLPARFPELQSEKRQDTRSDHGIFEASGIFV